MVAMYLRGNAPASLRTSSTQSLDELPTGKASGDAREYVVVIDLCVTPFGVSLVGSGK